MEELTLTESGMILLSPDKFKRTQEYLIKNDPDLPLQVLINNYNQITNIWDTKLLYNILSDETKRKNLEKSLTEFSQVNNLEGINIDFEELDDKTFPYYIDFLRELSEQLHSI